MMGRAHTERMTTLSGETPSAGAARRLVTDALARWGSHDLIDVVRLLTSELVTNAAIHAGPGIRLVVELNQGVVRVEVHDDDQADARVIPGRPGPEDSGGRGLVLVAALADRWGVEREPTGKFVWFETARRGS